MVKLSPLSLSFSLSLSPSVSSSISFFTSLTFLSLSPFLLFCLSVWSLNQSVFFFFLPACLFVCAISLSIFVCLSRVTLSFTPSTFSFSQILFCLSVWSLNQSVSFSLPACLFVCVISLSVCLPLSCPSIIHPIHLLSLSLRSFFVSRFHHSISLFFYACLSVCLCNQSVCLSV